MNILSALSQLILGPLLLLFEALFMMAYRVTGNPGLSILVLSLVMNLLVLPLYRRADAIQEEERCQQKRLASGADHIRKVFRGDERYLILQTFYRQNHYRPYYTLRGSLSLLLEIPFFIAAYRFLSGLQLLQGAALGPIADLSLQDRLLHVGRRGLNVLPVLMTGINIVSGAIYTRGMPRRSKIQLYGMALVFLVFLYRSPSGLVLYWTLNNLFSLGKNLVQAAFRGKEKKKREDVSFPGTGGVFWLSAGVVCLLLGAYLPLRVIAASPQEFLPPEGLSVLRYAGNALLLSAGTFLLWFGIFYWMGKGRTRRHLALGMLILAGMAAVNVLCFGNDYGTISSVLQYHQTPLNTASKIVFNLLLMVGISFVLLCAVRRYQGAVKTILAAGLCTMAVLSLLNAVTVRREEGKARENLAVQTEENAEISLSQDGKNVIVLMMDRAVNGFFEPALEEDPDLARQFAGFTFYPNTLSFGGHTNVAAPALFGGYEYIPEAMDARDTEPLQEKHDEALRVMPALFSEAGYAVTVCDPTLAGYSEIPDLGIYADMPGVKATVTEGRFSLEGFEAEDGADSVRMRNFFCYSLYRAAPLLLQPLLYNDGLYNASESISYVTQVWDGMHRAVGVDETFIRAYAVLHNLPEMTKVNPGQEGTFLMMVNNTTHEPMLLQAPEYEPSLHVDNTDYDACHDYWYERTDRPGIYTEFQMAHYHANMAALRQLGRWFDMLREAGVYDNTRIIVVSDHGANLGLFGEELLGSMRYDLMYYHPLLLVKDFGAQELQVDERFMTNADTPYLAMEGIINDPVNPFTGQEMTGAEKHAEELHVAHTDLFDVQENNGNTYAGVHWLAVHEDVRRPQNWREMDAGEMK